MMISNYNSYSPCNTNLASFNQYTNTNLDQQQQIAFATEKHKNSSYIHNIQSFNLDTHLDMSRYTYLAGDQNNANIISNRQLETCLAVDCNLESYSSLSSSSSTSSSTTSLSSTTSNIKPSTGGASAPPALDLTSKPAKPKLQLAKASPFASSSECLSSDEGYVGSYSDTNNLKAQRAPLDESSARANLHQQINKLLSPEDQLKLLKFLLNQQFLKQQQLQLQQQQQQQQQIEDLVSSDEEEEQELDIKLAEIIEPVFKPAKLDNEVSLLNLNEPTELSLSWRESSPAELGPIPTGFDIGNQLLEIETQIIKKKYTNENEEPKCECHLAHSSQNDLYLSDLFEFIWSNVPDELKPKPSSSSSRELKCEKCLFSIDQLEADELLNKLNSIRLEREKQDELEMYTRNWRFILERKQSDEAKQREFSAEDSVDLDAYLNEIDMNFEYYHQDELKIELDFVDDLKLRFRNTKSAFNLRAYHNCLARSKGETSSLSSMFANLHVDSIPEFVPVPENASDEERLELDSTVVDNENNGTIVYNECEMEDEYYYAQEDYEDYEDQMYIDSLSEEEALALLRSESELYALHMAQASKSGLKLEQAELGEASSDSNNNNLGEEGKLDTTNGLACPTSEDIFENVFNFYETPMLDDQDPSDQQSEEYFYGTEAYATADSETSEISSSTISLSLRNSLLKLRHSRRHLAALIEQNAQKSASNGNSTTTSSTTSSLTTSNMSLYKAHMMNIQASSRKPCVYMLNEGRCARADCRFVHDLKTITCKYWMEGECLKGENCEFLHEFVEETPTGRSGQHRASFSSSYSSSSGRKGKNASATSEPVVIKKDFKLDSEEFPALGLTAAKTNANKSPAGSSSAAAVVLKQPVKTAASVLLSNVGKVQTSKAVNIVQNKKQPEAAAKKKASKGKIEDKKSTGANPSSKKSDDLDCGGHKARDQHQQQQQQIKKKEAPKLSKNGGKANKDNSGSRGSSVIRNKK